MVETEIYISPILVSNWHNVLQAVKEFWTVGLLIVISKRFMRWHPIISCLGGVKIKVETNAMPDVN